MWKLLARLVRNGSRGSAISGLAVLVGVATLGCSVSACGDKTSDHPFPADWPRPSFETGKIAVDGHELTIELADTSKLRRYGYMFVPKPPADDEGMLFIYPTLYPSLNFWMRNTRVALDLVYIEEDGTIMNIHREMVPGKENTHYEALGPCRFVLEVRGGWCDDHHVYAGKKVAIPDSIRNRQAEPNIVLDDGEGGNIPRIPR